MASPALTHPPFVWHHHRHHTACRRPAAWTVGTAAAIPVVLLGGWIVADQVQPASFDPVRQTVSVAAGLGAQDRWIMTASLFVVAGCYLVTAAGLDALRRAARGWLVATGLAAAGIAALPEPAGGTTLQHALVTGVGAVLMAGWPVLARRPGPAAPWVLGRTVTAVATAGFGAMLVWLFVETRDGAVLGLAERLCSGVQVCWPFVVTVALRRQGDGVR